MSSCSWAVCWPYCHTQHEHSGSLNPSESACCASVLRPPAWIAALRQGLREHGLIEGQNIEIELGLAQSVTELPGIAAELVRHNVNILFASGSPTVLPAKSAAGAIPVVFVGIFDFVGTGEVASLARPGGNIIGISGMGADLAGKRMQLLRSCSPA